MIFKFINQKFILNDKLTVYHICKANTDNIIHLKLKNICSKALSDNKFSLKHCFEIEDYKSKPSTLLFQFYNNLMNVIILEVEQTKHAIMGYSIYDDIALCPRRVFCEPELRNRNKYPVAEFSFGDIIMPSLEEMFKNIGINYIAITFNKTTTGTSHFRTYTDRKNLKKIITRGNYFTDFIPVSQESMNIFGNQQYVIYKKLETYSNKIPNLNIQKIVDQVK